MGQDFLACKLGDKLRTLTINNVEKREVTLKEDKGTAERVVLLTTEKDRDRDFELSDVYVKDYKGFRIQGLWFSFVEGRIPPTSALGKVLHHYKVDTLNELIGMDVMAYPDKNNYLVLVACDPKHLNT